MIKINPIQRYSSFSEIVRDISAGVLSEIDFLPKEIEIYRGFAGELADHIIHYTNKYSPINNIPLTLSKLAELIRCSSLEDCIQSNSKLINCFIDGNYSYKTNKEIKVKMVIDFYGLVTSLSLTKQKIVFDNIYNRLLSISVNISDDELPF